MSNLLPWVPLTADDLISPMTQRERDNFGKISTGTVEDRVTPILADQVNEIRGFIGSHSGNTLSADPTLIPPEFKAKALAVARWTLLTSFPSYEPSKARELAYEKADTFFRDVAKGTIRPRPAPDAEANPVPDAKHHTSPRINARKRRFSRDQQDGI